MKKSNTTTEIFSLFCYQWLDLYSGRLKNSSYVKYQSILSNHIIPWFGDFQPGSINTVEIGVFTKYLFEHKQLSVKSVRDILSLLQSILSYINRNYPEIMPKVSIVYPKEEQKTLRVLSRSEQERLMHYLEADTDIYKFGVMLALTSGIRVGELCGLRWENISFKDSTLSINATVQRIKATSPNSPTKTVLQISAPKTKSSVRVLPMTKKVTYLCDGFKVNNLRAFVLTGTEEFIEPRQLQRKLKEYTDACNLKHVHFHTLRHTFATRCIESGCDAKTLSEFLGHSNVSITMNRYVHPSLDLKRQALRRLENAGFF